MTWTGLVLVASYVAFIGSIQALLHQVTYDPSPYSPIPYAITIIHSIGQPLALGVLGLGSALVALGFWTRWTSTAGDLLRGPEDVAADDVAAELPPEATPDPEQSFRPEGARHG